MASTFSLALEELQWWAKNVLFLLCKLNYSHDEGHLLHGKRSSCSFLTLFSHSRQIQPNTDSILNRKKKCFVYTCPAEALTSCSSDVLHSYFSTVEKPSPAWSFTLDFKAFRTLVWTGCNQSALASLSFNGVQLNSSKSDHAVMWVKSRFFQVNNL